MLPHRAHRSVTSLQLARPCGLAARFYATPAARKATLFPAKPTAPPPAAPAEPAFKPKTAAGGRIVEQPRAPALVKLQERMLSFHTVRALLQLGGDFAGWMSLAAGSAGPNGAKVDRMEAMLMMRTRANIAKIVGWTALISFVAKIGPSFAVSYALVVPLLVGVFPNVVGIGPTTFIKEGVWIKHAIKEEQNRIRLARLILASLQKHCEAILSSSNSTPKQKNDAKKLLNLIQNPPAAKGPDVMVTQHNLHDFFLKEWNLFKLPAASQDLYPHLARFVGLPFEFVLPRLRLARRVDWIIAKDDAMLLKPENDLSKYEDADILEAAEDRWFVPLLARFGAADKVPGKVREIESSQFRSSLLGSVQSHVKFVQGMLVKHGEMPMPPPEDMEVLPDSEKDRLKDLQRRNREEDKRFTTEGLGAVGGLVLVGRCLEIVEAAKRLNL